MLNSLNVKIDHLSRTKNNNSMTNGSSMPVVEMLPIITGMSALSNGCVICGGNGLPPLPVSYPT